MSFFKTVFKKVFTIPSKRSKNILTLNNLFKTVKIEGTVLDSDMVAIYNVIKNTGIDYTGWNLRLRPDTSEYQSMVTEPDHTIIISWNIFTDLRDLSYIILHELRHAQQYDIGDLGYRWSTEHSRFITTYKGTDYPHDRLQVDDHIKLLWELDANNYAMSILGSDSYTSHVVNEIVIKTLEYQEEVRNKAA